MQFKSIGLLVACALASLAACSSEHSGANDAATSWDAGQITGSHDAAIADATAHDATGHDAAVVADADIIDATVFDAAPADAALIDMAVADALADAPPADMFDPCSVCDEHAACVDGDAGRACECSVGYEGDGVTCTEVVASLSALRWELPCAGGNNGTSCPTSDVSDSTIAGGATGAEYDVELHFRGIVEQRSYTGGTQDGYWYIGGDEPSSSDPYNIYKLEISSPAQTYYLNAGTSAITRCWAIDYARTVRVATGATVTLSARALDAAEIYNHGDTTDPIIIDDVSVMQPYDGQFVEVEVVSVTRVMP